jgi:hypothetical protein
MANTTIDKDVLGVVGSMSFANLTANNQTAMNASVSTLSQDIITALNGGATQGQLANEIGTDFATGFNNPTLITTGQSVSVAPTMILPAIDNDANAIVQSFSFGNLEGNDIAPMNAAVSQLSQHIVALESSNLDPSIIQARLASDLAADFAAATPPAPPPSAGTGGVSDPGGFSAPGGVSSPGGVSTGGVVPAPAPPPATPDINGDVLSVVQSMSFANLASNNQVALNASLSTLADDITTTLGNGTTQAQLSVEIANDFATGFNVTFGPAGPTPASPASFIDGDVAKVAQGLDFSHLAANNQVAVNAALSQLADDITTDLAAGVPQAQLQSQIVHDLVFDFAGQTAPAPSSPPPPAAPPPPPTPQQITGQDVATLISGLQHHASASTTANAESALAHDYFAANGSSNAGLAHIEQGLNLPAAFTAGGLTHQQEQTAAQAIHTDLSHLWHG